MDIYSVGLLDVRVGVGGCWQSCREVLVILETFEEKQVIYSPSRFLIRFSTKSPLVVMAVVSGARSLSLPDPVPSFSQLLGGEGGGEGAGALRSRRLACFVNESL